MSWSHVAIAVASFVSAAAAPSAQRAPASSEPDPAVRELVRKEVEKAKEDMREEIRNEVQGVQASRDFSGAGGAGNGKKLDLLEIDGYLRVRGDLFDSFDLRRDPDPSGFFLYPRPLVGKTEHSTLTSGNMRLRLEPTLNVSEQIRVHTQIDILDDLVLGSTTEGIYAQTTSAAFPFLSGTQVAPVDGVNADRGSIVAKRAWAEVQTPLGLLSFGRMPSSWGLGILAHDGSGIDDDRGDTADRIQFALTPLKTPIGPLVLVPMYEITATGVTSQDLGNGRGLGQPFDRDQADDAKALGIKIIRSDTETEVRRRLARGGSSTSFGLWYMYKSQRYELPGQLTQSVVPNEGSSRDGDQTSNTNMGNAIKRGASAHVLDLWTKYQTKRFRFEIELAGLIGQIDNASGDASEPLGPVLLRQFGGVAQAAYRFGDKLTLSGEFGVASGDTNPGLGNQPGRSCNVSATGARTCTGLNSRDHQGYIDGQQFAEGDKVLDVRNFRFNPAYRVDMILWREILRGVTDAAYFKPTLRYEIVEGLAAQLSIIYSHAIYAASTPSGVNNPLGVEFDLGLSYRSDDGFIAFLNYGLLQPLDGLKYHPGYEVPSGFPNQTMPGNDITRAHAIRSGIAVRF